eukprot:4153082-Alexandrium_andersonii.AAC.1
MWRASSGAHRPGGGDPVGSACAHDPPEVGPAGSHAAAAEGGAGRGAPPGLHPNSGHEGTLHSAPA